MIIRREAERDIAKAEDWYEDQRDGLGLKFRAALESVLLRLESVPEIARVVYRDFRRVVIPKFPYAVFYRVEDGEVVVWAVVDLRRDPDRWQLRLSD